MRRPTRHARTKRPAPAPGRTPRAPAPSGTSGPTEAAARRIALGILVLYAVVLGVVVLIGHPTPLYQVETDLVGEYIPAAKDLLRGKFTAEHYTSKGFGYPLLLAGATALAGGDGFLAARVLNVIAAVAGAALAYALFAGLLGAWQALIVLVGLVVTPCYVQGAIEAGTDLPTFALSIAATVLVLRARHDDGSRGSRSLFLAGVLAGYAIITRYNSAFLPLAALVLLATAPRPLRRVAAYAAGVAIPVVPWVIASLGVPGGVFGGQNPMNVAYEFYGQGLGQDAFWSQNSARFHSMFDVIRHDPARFAGHLAVNLGTRWFQHASQLWVLPLGYAAVLGLAAGAWRRPGGGGIALHFGLCYAVLATVFFLPRFHIYLAPFYLSGVAWLAFALFSPGALARRPAAPAPARAPAWALPASLALGLALIAPTALRSILEERMLLGKAPEEARVAGTVLRALGPPDAGVIARQPHVAYFANMRYVPFPDVASYGELFDVAHRTGARYVYYSITESYSRRRLLPLSSGNARLPGLEPVRSARLGPSHFYALYRFTGVTVSPESLQSAALDLAHQFAAKRATDPPSQLALAEELMAAQHYAEALEVLGVARRLAPDWGALPPVIARAESLARR